jgi:alkyl hydroperoxide reductase subunit AhpC
LRIGDRAPQFKVKGILGAQAAENSLDSGKGQWLVQFFVPEISLPS